MGQERSPPAGRQDRVVLGVATLDRSPDQSPGVRPISPSQKELREPGGVALLGGVQIRWGRGSTPWSGYFSRPVSMQGLTLLWGKVQLGVALPCHGLWSMGTQGTQSTHSRRRIKLGSCKQRELYLLLL